MAPAALMAHCCPVLPPTLAHHSAFAAPHVHPYSAFGLHSHSHAQAQLGILTCPEPHLALRSKSVVYEPALNYLVRVQTWTVYKVSVLRSPSPYLNLLVNTGLGKPFSILCSR